MTTSPIDNAINGMNQLAQSLAQGGGGKDLLMSTAAQHSVMAAIKTHRKDIQDQYNAAAAKLTHYGYPGAFKSADQVKKMLTDDVTGGVLTTLRKYLDLLDAYGEVVNTAFVEQIGLDQSGLSLS